METIVHAGLANAAAATVLALLAAGVGRVVRRPALAHSLWLLVLLKLLTPPLLPLPVLGPAPRAGAPEKAALVAPTGESSAEPDSPTSWTAGPEPGAGEPAPDAPAGSSRWEIVLAVVWLTGAGLWWAVAGLRLYRFHRLLRQARPAPPPLQEQVRDLAGRLGLTRCPAVWLVSAPLSPLVWALTGGPRLVLPAALWEQLTPPQRVALLTHELAHLRRRDHWVRRLELVALGLYWWHPVVWWARRELQEAEEQCCDAWVVWALPEAAPVYAEALVETVAFLSRARTVLPVGASGVGQVKCLRRRLTMILSQTTPRSLSRVGCWAVVALGAVLLPWGPTWAQAPAPGDALFLVQFQDGGTVPPLPLRGRESHGDVRAEARDVVELLKARLDSRRAELQEVMARLKQAEHERERLEPIRPPAASPSTGDGTGSIFSRREADEKALDKARAEVDILKARVAGKKAQVREAEVYLRQAQRRLEGLQHPTAVEAEKLRDLEQKLDQLRDEMQLLRGELRPPQVRFASPAPSPSTVILTINRRTFRLPFAIDPGQRPRLKELRLYSSTDQGRTWRQAAVASPDQDAFVFTAPADGLYWFTVRTVDQEGKLDAPTSQSRPCQQIQVTTQRDERTQAPGPPPRAIRVGQIIITGNDKTSSDVILKEVPLFPGQVLSYLELRKAEKNLAKLNLFVVDPKKGVRPTVTVIDADTDSEFKDIVIQVQEK